MEHPFVEFQHFRQKYFTLAIISNVMFHLSMMATMILVPIMIEEGLGKSPIFVTAVLLPHQSFGIWLPAIAGFVHDKFNPRLLRTACMLSIAVGVCAAGDVRGLGVVLVAAAPAVPDLGGDEHL